MGYQFEETQKDFHRPIFQVGKRRQLTQMVMTGDNDDGGDDDEEEDNDDGGR